MRRGHSSLAMLPQPPEDMTDQDGGDQGEADSLEVERTLVARIRGGDPEAFATLMAQFANRLARFAFHMVNSRDAAEDVVQQVFVQLWERRASFAPSQLKPYLFGAVRNRALQYQRAERVRGRYRATAQEETDTDTLSIVVPSPEGHILTNATIQAAVERLSERRRLAVRLRLEEDMTNAEIAEVLGLSLVATKQLVARAIVDLRKMLLANG